MTALILAATLIGSATLVLALRDAIVERKRERIMARVRDWERANPLKASWLMNWRRGV